MYNFIIRGYFMKYFVFYMLLLVATFWALNEDLDLGLLLLCMDIFFLFLI